MNKRDLTSGSIYGNLIYMALPTMLGFLAQTLYNVVDMIWIGMISPEAVSGVTVYTTIFVIVYVFNDVIGTSSVSLISQAYGERDIERTQKVIEQSITFKALVAFAAGLLMLIFLKPLVRFFTDDPLAFKAAIDYGYIRTFFLPIMFSSYTVNTAMRCIGDSKKPLYIMLIVSILNVVLDPLFMFETMPFTILGQSIPGLGLGVFGAALATVVSTIVAFGIAFWFILSGKTYVKIRLSQLFKLDKEIDRKLITIGLPSGLDGFNRNISNFILFKMISLYGTSFIAAYGIVIRIIDLCVMPLAGLNMGGSTLVGQNIGARQIDRAKKSVSAAVKLGVFILLLVNILTRIYSKSLMGFFIDDAKVIDLGSEILNFVMPAMLFLAVMYGVGSAFSGSGDTKPFLFASLTSRWLVMIPVAFVTTEVLKTDFRGLLLAYVLAEFTDMFVIVVQYFRGKWQTMKV